MTLRADGLGTLTFGDPTASAMRALETLLGPATPGEEYPYEGHPLRHVYWMDAGLAVVFSEYDFYRSDGVEHLAGWVHGHHLGDMAGWGQDSPISPLQTTEGVGIGATLADLQATYPGQVTLEAVCDPGGPPTMAVVEFTGEGGGRYVILVGFEALPLGPASHISFMEAGAGPGC